MNEKIKQLIEAAGYSTDPVPYLNPGVDPRLEKFAELIVKECIGVVEKQKAKMSYGPTFVIADIKQHFGIEL